MAINHVTSGPGIPQTGAAYSPAVVANGTCYVSGQLPLDPQTGAVVVGSFSDQVRQTLVNVEATLAAAGFTIDNLVSATVVLADIADWQDLDHAWAAFFAGHPLPSRFVFEAGALALGARVEIQAVAVQA
jgi:2-iminobutanoate/2-iminopropanoate deaminase